MLCGSCFIIGVASICILFPSGLVKRLMRSRKWGYESFLILWSDFVKIQLTNVSEFTNSRTNISNFTNSRTIFCLFTIHEQHRFHEFTNDFFGFHEFTNEKKPIPACTNNAGGASQKYLPVPPPPGVTVLTFYFWHLLWNHYQRENSLGCGKFIKIWNLWIMTERIYFWGISSLPTPLLTNIHGA